MKDDQTTMSSETPRKRRRKRRTKRTGSFQAAAVLLTVLCLVAAVGCWLQPPRDVPSPREVRPTHDVSPLFQNWPKTQPLAVLVFTNQIHGYLNPCGCSKPQYGGFERLYNFEQQLKERGWPVIMLDGGDIAQAHAPAGLPNIQGKIKYRYSMEAKEKMGTTAVGFGADDASLSLFELLGEWALNNEKPAVLLGNLMDREDFPPHRDEGVAKPEGNSAIGLWRITQPSSEVKIGVVGVVSTHEAEKDPHTQEMVFSIGDQITKIEQNRYQFAPTDKTVKKALAEMNKTEKPNFRVLLYQGSFEKAKKVAELVPEFNVILCLDVDEPPSTPELVGTTFVVRVGHKGKNVGIVGVFPPKKAGEPFEMRYQLAAIAPKYETPPAKAAAQPIVKIMERYQKELRMDGYLEKYSQKPHEVQIAARALKNAAGAPRYPGQISDYVGSETCKKCHTDAYDTWKDSPHSPYGKDKRGGPFQTLADVTNPGNRIFDGECIVCHTTGFTYETGYSVKFDRKKAGVVSDETVKLRDVGCESCHGPSGLHARNPKDKDLYTIINPWGGNPKQFEKMCMQCHDHENDVHWTINKWWTGKIFHGSGQDKPTEEPKPQP